MKHLSATTCAGKRPTTALQGCPNPELAQQVCRTFAATHCWELEQIIKSGPGASEQRNQPSGYGAGMAQQRPDSLQYITEKRA